MKVYQLKQLSPLPPPQLRQLLWATEFVSPNVKAQHNNYTTHLFGNPLTQTHRIELRQKFPVIYLGNFCNFHKCCFLCVQYPKLTSVGTNQITIKRHYSCNSFMLQNSQVLLLALNIETYSYLFFYLMITKLSSLIFR